MKLNIISNIFATVLCICSYSLSAESIDQETMNSLNLQEGNPMRFVTLEKCYEGPGVPECFDPDYGGYPSYDYYSADYEIHRKEERKRIYRARLKKVAAPKTTQPIVVDVTIDNNPAKTTVKPVK